MCSMCHYCGAEPKLNDQNEKLEDGNPLKLNGEGPLEACRFCLEKWEKELPKRDCMSPSTSPMISPTTSLSSSDRSVSSCSDISVDVNSYDGYNQEHAMVDSTQEYLSNGVNDRRHNPSLEAPESANGDSENGENESPHCGDDKMDAKVWEPPEAEDPEDDLEGSVAFNDDDDEECGDGTKWGKPTLLSGSGDDGSGSYKFKEEKQKAMEEVINGKFKAVVSQLLKTAGVATSGKDGESWVDIITSLAWEAASFLKPDAIDGKAMDPYGYVKVKCIAAGSRSESQLFKGLVFKKHAAHKHMRTKYKNPRLLLMRGELGQSSSGLSSFKTMDQEKDNLKFLMEMIEMCHPNVVLVEKSVSRDVQESILKNGITLVYDMKLHRLERIARCTGSPIFSSDALMNQKLKQCDSFYIEKFVEEHSGLSEGEKKPSKTLMFIEGCPTRLGCTILLKGSHSEELKRIKYVVQIAVVMAYQLILETSFLVDQKAMFSTILYAGIDNITPSDQLSSILEMGKSNIPSTIETEPSTTNISISNGFHEEGSHNLKMGLEGDAALSYVPYNPVIFSGFSSFSASLASLKKVVGDNLTSSAPYWPLSNYFGFNGREMNDQLTEDVPIFRTSEAADSCDLEPGGGSDKEKLLVDQHTQSFTSPSEAQLDKAKGYDNDENQVQRKDDVNALLDSQSILVLMSRRNARGAICEQSRFSHIMFYRNFDVPLGKFLRDNLLNQKSQCNSCGELPEAHFYYYANHNKQLTVRVTRLLNSLTGEAEGKLWMWSRCGKCKHENGVPISTKRVLISTAARSLSFGKFLELSFSHYASSSRASSCGHLLDRDFLYFFGLGPMAAMFKYSPVTTYTVYPPPLNLEFSHSVRTDGLKQEFEDVVSKGILLFSSVADTLKKLRSQFVGSPMNLRGSLKEFSDIEDMLKQEQSDFEVSIHNAAAKNLNSGNAVHKLLFLNRLLWEILLESYIWERRLHSLLLRDPSLVGSGATEKVVQNHLKSKNGTIDGRNEGGEIAMANGVKVSDHSTNLNGRIHTSDVKDNPVDSLSNSFSVADNIALSSDLETERTIPIAGDVESGDSVVDLDASSKVTSPHSLVITLENLNGWFWMPFSEIRQIYMKDLQRGFMPKFHPISSYEQECLSAIHQLITEEGSRLHIPLGTDNYFVRDYDGELSSIIACALAFLKDLSLSTEFFYEDGRKEGSLSVKSTDGSHILARFPTMTSKHWPSIGSSDLDSIHSTLSMSSEDSRFSSFDGLNLLESLVPPENLSPEVSLGFVKSLGKGKYSVICLYAKQFRDLRSRCCPSELDFIASLSRCKKWDAKGGKSKSVFAKTLDDRFIIKEIKKTEFESFVKFAPDYFKHMNESFESGNQTCLAKVLGIYQVIIRQTKSGKEMRHDLMVMENLTFGRNITRQYDLKGALHARYNSAADGSGDVLLDQNFVNDMNNSPLYVSHKAKRLLERAVWNDTTFLNSINVMDYSLLVGVDSQRRELVCGIIDYLRQYTWDKQLETWVKSFSLVVPRNVLPTVISPKEYKKRFRKFMGTHFLSVPDDWCSQRSSDPCQLCGVKDDGSSQLKSPKRREVNGFSH